MGEVINMKKTFVLPRLCFLFLTLVCISGSALANPHQNSSNSNPIFIININHTDTFANTVSVMNDDLPNIIPQEELRGINNSEVIITSKRFF
jgi:hypothetical protein